VALLFGIGLDLIEYETKVILFVLAP